MLSSLLRRLGGEGTLGLSRGELDRLCRRNPFSRFLPYLAYDEETKTYLLQGDAVGALWECAPLAFASAQTVQGLDGLFRLGLPEGSVLQFVLHADPCIEPYLARYESLKTRNIAITRAFTAELADFLRSGRDGLKKLSGIPTRNFRLLVGLKVPSAKLTPVRWESVAAGTEEVLRGVNLWPRRFAPEDLLEWTRRLLNEDPGGNARHYDDTKELRDQILYAQTEVRDEGRHLRVGENYWACLTPKAHPKRVDLFTTGFLTGGVWGFVTDADQIQTPFLISVNLIFEGLNAKLHAKCNFVLGQGAAGSLAPSLARKKEEFTWAVDELERGKVFVRVLPTLWVWSQDKQHLAEALTRARRLWENLGYVMQQDRGILRVLFPLSLPFGLYLAGKNLDNISRDAIVDSDAATATLPVQADFAGAGKPVLLFVGRKGQLGTLDFFTPGANNHNFLVAAESGSGKSFLLQYILFNYWASEALVRLVDIGGSYKKLGRLVDARYIDFGAQEPPCLNPFTHIREPEHELAAVVGVVTQMVYSRTATQPSETESSLLEAAVQWAWEREGQGAEIDTVYEFLSKLRDVSSGESSLFTHPRILETSQMLAFNLREFTTDGAAGRFFNGKSSFDIRSDEFVVLELEHLKSRGPLFSVVTSLVLNAITQDLYLAEASDRERKRFLLFEEAWQFFRIGSGAIARIIEEGYRRARKYGGSFGVVIQSIEDMADWGPVGQVVLNNTAYRLLLQSKGFERARSQELVSYDDFTMRYLATLRSKPGDYSEIFLETPFGAGVVRLVVDPFAYGMFTSSPGENAFIERLVARGMTWEEAIRAFVQEHPWVKG